MLDEEFLLNIITNIIEDVTQLKAEVDAIRGNSYGQGITNTQNITETQDALCETSIDVDEHITTIEDALCELSKEE